MNLLSWTQKFGTDAGCRQYLFDSYARSWIVGDAMSSINARGAITKCC